MSSRLRWNVLFTGCIFAVICSLAGQIASAQTAMAAAKKTYAIVVSKPTYADPKWREVVDVLKAKHDGTVILYSSDVRQVRLELSAMMPDYICFVARQEEVSRTFDVRIHHMTRRLDDDPYTDAIWSILTGYDVADVLKVAKYAKPLVLSRTVTGTSSISLKPFESGLRFAEGKKGVMWTKTPDGKTTEGKCEPDAVKSMVDAMNDTKPQCFFTSGHATTNDWQIGYRFRGGQFRCDNGQLYGLDTRRKRYDINSPNPKVYLAVGNCLIGLISKRNCMALAWMHTGGAYQMFGHTANQWYGHMGWGMRHVLVSQPGRFNAVESFYMNQQSLLHRLVTEYPKIVNTLVEDFDNRRAARPMMDLASRNRLLKRDKSGKMGVDRDALGLLWERDSTIFYGDPAWDARLKSQPAAWDQKFTVKGNVYTFTVTINEDVSWRRWPVTALLPVRLEQIKIIKGGDLKPAIADNFIILPLKGKFKKGQTFKVVFKGKPLVRPRPAVLAEIETIKRGLPLVDESQRPAVQIALSRAGKNREQLIETLRNTPKQHRKAMAFLIANMPDHDLKTISGELLLENVKYAELAREKAPWAKQIPESLFHNYVLPYANVNERRDNWRKDFYDRFSAMAWKCKTAGEAAELLNKTIFKTLDVKYHPTKRTKPDQSPAESIKIKYASCTGLSIMLVDACRAVGIPARLVGIPQWKDRKGDKHGNHARNHNWSEIWDGRWHYLGSAEPKGLNKAWFTKKSRTAVDHAFWAHRVYAVSFRETARSFPLVWDLSMQWVKARDVTRFYSNLQKIRLSPPGKGKKKVTVWLDGEIVATGSGTDAVELFLADNLSYTVYVRTEGSKIHPAGSSYTMDIRVKNGKVQSTKMRPGR